MRRTVTARLSLTAAGPADLVLSLAVARGAHRIQEQLVVETNGASVPVAPVEARHGTHVLRVAVGPGRVDIHYHATVEGRDLAPPVVASDLLEYLRPSRYAEADKLTAFAADQFGTLEQFELLDAVVEWVGSRVAYVPGSSGPTDGAVDTLLTRRGVCRDFAHLVIGILRARAVPARLVAVYAPGLSPMDFHAVVEACIDGVWHVVDATRLAPRGTLLRIATGRDAADTAFLSSYGADVTLDQIQVTATSDGDLPWDDGTPHVLG